MRYWYKDFNTGKLHYTQGNFIDWYNNGQGIKCAVFACKSVNIYVPEYLLTKKTKQTIAKITGKGVKK